MLFYLVKILVLSLQKKKNVGKFCITLLTQKTLYNLHNIQTCIIIDNVFQNTNKKKYYKQQKYTLC
jgi:hypothetical protein